MVKAVASVLLATVNTKALRVSVVNIVAINSRQVRHAATHVVTRAGNNVAINSAVKSVNTVANRVLMRVRNTEAVSNVAPHAHSKMISQVPLVSHVLAVIIATRMRLISKSLLLVSHLVNRMPKVLPIKAKLLAVSDLRASRMLSFFFIKPGRFSRSVSGTGRIESQ